MYKIIGSDQKEYGPIPADQIRQWISEGRLNAQSLVFAEGDAEWKPLGSFPEFAGLFAAAATAPQPGSPPLAPLSMPTAPATNKFAVTGLIMGIISLFICCCYGLPFNVLGLIFSGIALSQINKAQGMQKGRGMAMTGLVLSIISVLFYVVMLIFVATHPGVVQQWQQQLQNRHGGL